MHKFEIKKSEPSICFGDLEDLRNQAVLPAVNFVHGNYTVFRDSLIDSNGRNRNSIVIHHENVDPDLALKKVDNPAEEKSKTQPATFQNLRTGNRKMFSAQRSWPDYWRKLDVENYGQHLWHCDLKDRSCQFCNESAAATSSRFASGGKIELWQLDLFGLIYQAYAVSGNLEEAKSLKFSDFFYFANNEHRNDLRHRNVSDLQVSIIENSILEFRNAKGIICFAINTRNLQENRMQTVALQDGDMCYALVLHYLVEDWPLVSEKSAVIWCRWESVQISELFYENEYRSFYKNGECQENPNYGANIGNQFDFDRLPDNVFQHLLSYLPWRQRAQCRRVSQRWTVASDLALAADTKVIDHHDDKFRSMEAADFGRLLPIAADRLQSITLSTHPGTLNWEHLIAVSSFRSLREITFGSEELLCDILFSILDKSPNLKKLDVPLGTAFPNFDKDSPKVYQLEEFKYGMNVITDSDLVSIADYFPKLTRITLDGEIFCTGGGLSAFVQRYGEILTYLEIKAEAPLVDMQLAAESRNFTAISSCSNLQYLSLSGGSWHIVCDHFINALTTACAKLHTLDLKDTRQMANSHLFALATLPQLKRLNIADAANRSEFSEGVTKIAVEGRLEQLLANDVELSVACLKALIRYCPFLKLLDRCDTMDIPVDDAVDIVHTYGRCGKAPYLVVRTRNMVWRNERVKAAQNEVKEGHFGQRRFIVDYRREKTGFLKEDDKEYEADVDSYEDALYDHVGGYPDFDNYDDYGYGGYGYDYGNDSDSSYDYENDPRYD